MNLSSVVNQKKDGGGWGGWFAPPKLLSSVTSFTTQILSTVENGLNIPEPEDLAKEDLLLDGIDPVNLYFKNDLFTLPEFNIQPKVTQKK